MGSPLEEFAKQYAPHIVGGIAGGAVGGGLGAYNTSQEEGESGSDFNKRRLGNATTGFLAGGAAGVSLPYLANKVENFFSQPPVTTGARLRALLNPMNHPYSVGAGEGAVGGAGVGAGIGAGVGHRVGGVLAGKPIIGGQSGQPGWEKHIESLEKFRDTFEKAVPGRGGAPGTSASPEWDLLNQRVRETTANQLRDNEFKNLFNPLKAFDKSIPFMERTGRLGALAGIVLGGLGGAVSPAMISSTSN